MPLSGLVAVVAHPEPHVVRAVVEVGDLHVARAADEAAVVVAVREDALAVQVQVADAGDVDGQGAILVLLDRHDVRVGLAIFLARPLARLVAGGVEDAVPVGVGAEREDAAHVGDHLGREAGGDRDVLGGGRPVVAVPVGVEGHPVHEIRDVVGVLREEHVDGDPEGRGVGAGLDLGGRTVAGVVRRDDVVAVQDVGLAGLGGTEDFDGGTHEAHGGGRSGVVAGVGVEVAVGAVAGPAVVAAHEGDHEDD